MEGFSFVALSPEEAFEIAYKKTTLPRTDAFPSDLIGEIEELTTHDGVASMDMMYLTGVLDKRQCEELMVLDPDFKDACKQAKGLAKKMVGSIPQKRIDLALDKLTVALTRQDIAKGRRHPGLLAAKKRKVDSSQRRVKGLLISMADILSDSINFTSSEHEPQFARVKLLKNMLTWFDAMLLIRILEAANKKPEAIHRNLTICFEELDILSIEETGVSFPGTVMQTSLAQYSEVFRTCASDLQNFFGSHRNDEEDIELTELENDEKFEEIEDLAFFRNVSTELEYKGAKISIIDARDGLVDSDIRGDKLRLCYVRVQFDPGGSDPFLEFVEESLTMNHYRSKTAIDFQVNRFGELTLMNSSTIGLHEFHRLDKREYEILRRVIFDELLRKLHQSPNNIPSYLDDVNPIAVASKMHEDLIGTLGSFDEPDASHDPVDTEIQQDTYQPYEPKADSLPNDEVPKESESHSLLPLPRGLRSSRAIQAIINILGYEPKRITGSHCIFDSRNGGTYPVPNHGRKQLGVGLLSKVLKELGISRSEFNEEVGYGSK